MKILLHHCCVPCSPMIVKNLKKDFDISSFWFNPNIQPEQEYFDRKWAFEAYVKTLGVPSYFGADTHEDIWGKNNYKDKTDRCRACYFLRLERTAVLAKELDIKHFSTTLLSSPQQMHELIHETGDALAKEHGLEFVYRDFRKDYYEGKDQARKEGYYIQKYCGCMPSKLEREEQKTKMKSGAKKILLNSTIHFSKM